MAFGYVVVFVGGILVRYVITDDAYTLKYSATLPRTWLTALGAIVIGLGLLKRFQWAWWAGVLAAIYRLHTGGAFILQHASRPGFEPSEYWSVIFIFLLALAFLLVLLLPRTRESCHVFIQSKGQVAVSAGKFRAMMLGSLALGVTAILLDTMSPNLLPQELRLVDAALMKNIPDSVLIIGLLYAIVGIIAFIGLFLFKPWARTLNVALVPVALAFWPLAGYTVSSGWAQALDYIALILWGAVLAVAYLTPLSERFTAA